MRETTDSKEFCGEIFNVGDCYVWAEIYYLDSPTDYREYISDYVPQRITDTGAEFVTLDKPFSWRAPKVFVTLLTMLFRSTWKPHRVPPIA